MNKKPACLIVDPFVSPIIICEALINHGIEPIALLCDHWSDPIWRMKRIQGAAFTEVIECDTSMHEQNLSHIIASYDVRGFIYGREGNSIVAADKIARGFFPEFCNEGNSAKRANKFDMFEACNHLNTSPIKQLRITSMQLNAKQISTISAILPIVIKPTQASGSIGVKICRTLEEAKKAIKELLNKPFVTGVVEELVIQPQFQGTEYFVDSLSLDNQHFFCGVFRYKKTFYHSKMIYRWIELVDHLTDEAKIAMDYVKNVLKAVGMRHGFAHTELFLTKNEPHLIEINPRISGAYGFANKMAKLAYHSNQAELLAEKLSNKNNQTGIVSHVPLKKYAITLCLQNWNPRKIRELDVLTLKKFPSYTEHLVLKPAGSTMETPTSFHDTVALVLLSHSSYETLIEDAENILLLEEKGCLF